MNEFTFRWFPPFTPGILEPILFLLFTIFFYLMVKWGVITKSFSSDDKFLILAGIFIAMGIGWTFIFRSSYQVIPWGLLASYLIIVVLLLFVYLLTKAHGVWVCWLVSIPLTFFTIRIFTSSEEVIYREALLENNVNIPSNKFTNKNDFNGYFLSMSFSGSTEKKEFINQGFALASEEANVNHMELLRDLTSNGVKKLKVGIQLDYRFWALSEARIVSINDLKFKNFYYFPAQKYPKERIKEWLPNSPLYNISLSIKK